MVQNFQQKKKKIKKHRLQHTISRVRAHAAGYQPASTIIVTNSSDDNNNDNCSSPTHISSSSNNNTSTAIEIATP